MKAIRPLLIIFLITLACGQGSPAESPTSAPSSQPPVLSPPPVSDEAGILIGTEYILIRRPERMETLAGMLAPLGIQAAKPLGEHIEWGSMQPDPEKPVDFTLLDAFVTEFQAAGFSELVLALKSHNPWASVQYGTLHTANPVPKPEHMQAYEDWIFSLVERYDGDGDTDMPGLRFPVRFYEIGSEFSSYEPEPAGQYIAMLERAYSAAHRASEDVLIAPAAFLTTLAFNDNPGPGDYEQAFEAIPDGSHSLEDMRLVLDRPDIFDVLNVHALGDPSEIEALVAWLSYEMAERDYTRDIIISDTTPAPFIAWGPANVCDRPERQMGRIIPPAVESDRCRLADYFDRLIEGDAAIVAWAQAYSAADMVKKVVIAAEQGVLLINTAFTEDLFWLKLPIMQAGAGNSAWAGLVDVERGEYRAGYYALQQLAEFLSESPHPTRQPDPQEGVRLYEFSRAGQRAWITWYEPPALLLPGDEPPAIQLVLALGVNQAVMEPFITRQGQSLPETETLHSQDGKITFQIGTAPVFIFENP